MYFRRKQTQDREYLQIVANTRVDGKPQQKVLATLGRVDELQASGQMDRLLESGARFSETALVLSALKTGEIDTIAQHRIGAPLVFERLWQESGCRAVIESLLQDRQFDVPLERAIFVTVLQRLLAPGSDRACERWHQAYRIEAADDLALHHFYRAMAWLGEELEDQAGCTRAPRCTKDLIEEQLFSQRRDLFNDLDLVFFDTSSLMLYGDGGETLGEHGHSKDHRPDLKQIVIGVVIDRHGRPICSETWPGNATDVQALLTVVHRLRQRFAIHRICVVADRGMISADTITELEAHEIDYILGTRERRDKEIHERVLADEGVFVPLSLPKAGGGSTEIEAKEVVITSFDPAIAPRRYIVCRNPDRAEHDAALREAVLDSLRRQLKRGEKALIGNKGYRRYLKREGEGRFQIKEDLIAEDAQYDGLYVLRTNTTLPLLEVAIRYRELWKVEAIFRTTKAVLQARPVYHSSDAAIRGHLFCCFLALILRKELQDRLDRSGTKAEWGDIVRDLDRLEETVVERDGKRFVLRAHTIGVAGLVCKAVGVALPPLFRRHDPPPDIRPKPRKRPKKIKLQPRRRSATA